jgi:hypothetical protein
VVTIMVDAREHGACVDEWMERAANRMPSDRLLGVFDQGFAALWGRAHQTLGDVTLMAIVDRVLYVAAEQYPFLSALKVEPTGLRCQELQRHAGSVHRDQLAQAVRFVLVEFLTVLGNLTAEILTPALHAELLKIAPVEAGPEDDSPQAGPQDPRSEAGAGAKS